jgi:hypothetical protein
MPRQDVGVPDRRRVRRRWSLPGSLARVRREDTSITPHLIAPRAISAVIARRAGVRGGKDRELPGEGDHARLSRARNPQSPLPGPRFVGYYHRQNCPPTKKVDHADGTARGYGPADRAGPAGRCGARLRCLAHCDRGLRGQRRVAVADRHRRVRPGRGLHGVGIWFGGW